MENSWSIYRLRGFLPAAIAVSIPLWPQLTIAVTALALLISVRELGRGISRFWETGELKWMMILFASLILGLAWTANVNAGLKEVKDELYVFLMPLVLVTGNYSTAEMRMAKKGLVWGSLLAITICMVWAMYSFLQTGDFHVFFYSTFSILLHPTNFAIVLAVSALFIVDDLRKNPIEIRSWKDYLLLYLNLLTIILLSSKGCYLACMLMFILAVLISYLRKNSFILKDKRLLITVALTLLSGAVLISKYNRIGQVISAAEAPDIRQEMKSGEVDSTIYNSTTIRAAQWAYSFELFRRQPVIGSGTGDEADDLIELFREKRDPYAVKHFRHPHSHYLHYLLMLGIPGLFISFMAIIRPFWLAWTRGNWPLVLFCSLLFTFGFTCMITHDTLSAIMGFGMSVMVLGDERDAPGELKSCLAEKY